MLFPQFHGYRQKRVDGGAVVPAGAKGVFAAGHEQAAALYPDEHIEGAQKIGGDMIGGDVVENHCSRAREMADVQLGWLGDHFEVDVMLLEDRGDRVVRVAGDEQNVPSPLNVDPAGGCVVTGVGVGLGMNVDAVGVGAHGVDAVTKLHHAPAVLYLRSTAMYADAVTGDDIGNRAVSIAGEVGFEHKTFGRLYLSGQLKPGDAYIAYPARGEQAVVKWHLILREPLGNIVQGLSTVAIGEDEQARGA